MTLSEIVVLAWYRAWGEAMLRYAYINYGPQYCNETFGTHFIIKEQ